MRALKRRTLAGLVCILCVGVACAATGTEPDEALPAWPAPPQADGFLAGTDLPDIDLFIGETQVLHVPGVARIAVGNGRVVHADAAGDRDVVVFGNAAGSSSLVIWNRDGSAQRVRVNVAAAQSARTQQEIAALLAGMPAVRTRAVGDKLIVEGEDLSSADQARVAMLARHYPQVVDLTGELGWERMVMMDVKVIELPRSRVQELGIKWDAASTGGLNAGVAWDAAAGRALAAGGADGPVRPGESPLAMPFPTGGATGYLGMNALLSSRIQALAQKGDAVVLAQPQLSARSGSTASFLAGGEVPYATTDRNGASNTIFKPYGVTLHITPRVDRGGTVRSLIDVEVSAVDPSVTGTGGPALKVRRTSTEFNVRSGQTLVLSGFLSRERSTDEDGLPWLSRLPVLGWLFGSRRSALRETELLVFVTPSVVTADNPALHERVERGERVLGEAFGPERLDVPVRPDVLFPIKD